MQQLRYFTAFIILAVYFCLWFNSQPKQLSAQDGVQQVTSSGHSLVQHNPLQKVYDAGWVVVIGAVFVLCVPFKLKK